ncbi:hypothetical protein L9F63_004193, partial [Diploptera punctata]
PNISAVVTVLISGLFAEVDVHYILTTVFIVYVCLCFNHFFSVRHCLEKHPYRDRFQNLDASSSFFQEVVVKYG